MADRNDDEGRLEHRAHAQAARYRDSIHDPVKGKNSIGARFAGQAKANQAPFWSALASRCTGDRGGVNGRCPNGDTCGKTKKKPGTVRRECTHDDHLSEAGG